MEVASNLEPAPTHHHSHKKRKHDCIQCGGAGICEHRRIRRRCVDCKGSMICVHATLRVACVECGGSQTCVHRMLRRKCVDCMPLERLLQTKRFCNVCGVTRVSQERLRAGIRKCATCDAQTPTRIEKVLRPKLIGVIGFPPSCMDNLHFGGSECGTNVRRPDLGWLGQDRAIFVEIDEHSHFDRTPSCELGKVWDTTHAVKQLMGQDTHVFFFRLNPDACDSGNVTLEQRVAHVGSLVKELLTLDLSTLKPYAPNIGYYYYHSRAAHHVTYSFDHPNSVFVFHPLPKP